MGLSSLGSPGGGCCTGPVYGCHANRTAFHAAQTCSDSQDEQAVAVRRHTRGVPELPLLPPNALHRC
jgi:hypothetical protein